MENKLGASSENVKSKIRENGWTPYVTENNRD
jgi:hypothetical protein